MDAGKSWIHRTGRIAAWLALFGLFLISVVFIGQFVGVSSGWAAVFALLGWAAIVRYCQLRRGGIIVLSIALVSVAGYFTQRPSNDRNWIPDIARLPSFQTEGNILKVDNLRDFAWSSTNVFEERWLNASYDLSQLKGVDVIVVPFGEAELAAHVMLSFGFEDGRRLALSVETRPEVGEAYSLIGGAARQLELIYLFGTERDLLGLRILHRGNQVYSFPLKADAKFARELLLELCQAANQLHDEPKFYATLRHNCTTTLLRHVKYLRKESIGLHREVIFPARFGELLHRLGYLDTELDWPNAKEFFRVDERIKGASDLTQFSKILRNEGS